MDDFDLLQNAWDDAVAHNANKASAPAPAKQKFEKGPDLIVPDGEHIGIIRRAGHSDKNGRSFCYWEVEYPELGGTRTIYANIEPNEMKMRILAGQLDALGLKVSSPASIPNVINNCVGYKVRIKKTSKPGNTGKIWENFYFKSVIEKPSSVTDGPIIDPASGEQSTDEIPW